MASHVVMLPPLASPQAEAERAVLVRDGFTWMAFFIPLLWLLWHRLWLETAIAVLLMAVFFALGEIVGLGPAGTFLGPLVGLYVGLEGQAMRVASLRRRGYQQWGVVEADNSDDAYMRYAHEIAAGSEERQRLEPAAAMKRPQVPLQPMMPPAPSLGLTPYGRN